MKKAFTLTVSLALSLILLLTGPAASLLSTQAFAADATTAQLNTGDMLSACVDALSRGSYVIDTPSYTYAFYHGSPDSLQKYTQYTKGATSTQD